jgi:hypothetical protein
MLEHVDIKFNAVLGGTLLGDEHFFRWNTLSYNTMVGVSLYFTKWLPLFFKIWDLLYIGQHPQSRGVTEIRTPPQEGPYFSKDPLLGC